jgi:hypothetical protein
MSPTDWSCHSTCDIFILVFHISQLKSCQRDPDDPSRVEPSRAPTMVVDKPELEVENILVHHILGWGRGRVHEYFVHWKDKPDEEDNWERYESLWKYEDMIRGV